MHLIYCLFSGPTTATLCTDGGDKKECTDTQTTLCTTVDVDRYFCRPSLVVYDGKPKHERVQSAADTTQAFVMFSLSGRYSWPNHTQIPKEDTLLIHGAMRLLTIILQNQYLHLIRSLLIKFFVVATKCTGTHNVVGRITFCCVAKISSHFILLFKFVADFDAVSGAHAHC